MSACGAANESARPDSLSDASPPSPRADENVLAEHLLDKPPVDSLPNRNERQSKHEFGGEIVEGAVPSFELTDLSGESVSSRDLVGRQAFAVVFFATWCELCSQKMPLIRRAVEKTHGVRVLFVAVDTSDTWSHIPGFMREQRLDHAQVVNGLEFPEFVRGYNPVSSIPLIAVIGRQGALVDYQIGLHEDDGRRLESSLQSALRQD